MPLTIVITIGCFLVATIIGLDIYFAIDPIKGNTWSELIRSWGRVAPIVPFVCGVLSGHFFSWCDHAVLKQPGGIAVLIWLACLVSMIGFSLARGEGNLPSYAIFVVGFIAGAFFWPCT